MAKITQGEKDERKVVALATATILMAAAALEALLLEAAYLSERSTYEDEKFRCSGAPAKFEKLKRRKSQEAIDLWQARKAVAHAEPDHDRTRLVGIKLNAQGAEWAASSIEKISKEIWGASVPPWFSETTGIT